MLAALDREGAPHSCASPLPALEVGNAEDARSAVREFIAGVVSAPAASIEPHPVECGTSMTTACARQFQHDLYKSNGFLGESLFPAAEQLEACASTVELNIWVPTVDGPQGPAIVCISGIANHHLIGIAFFNDLDTCP